MREPELKLALIRWLLSDIKREEVLAAELHFAGAQNRADLVVSSPETLRAYEIKSSYDDFRRYALQQSAYRRAFLESFLVVPRGLLATARLHLLSATGIVVVEESGEVRAVRKAIKKERLARDDASSWLTYEDRRRIEMSIKRQGIDSVSGEELNALALKAVHMRLRARFDAFLRERGQILNSDDLAMLSAATRIR